MLWRESGGTGMERIEKIRWIETAAFILGWILVFLLGADFPPPSGFIWIVVTVLFLAFLQHLYLCWLHRHISTEKTFLKNAILFASAGILVSNMFIILNGTYSGEVYIWILIITAVSVLYGIFLWIINLYIVRTINK